MFLLDQELTSIQLCALHMEMRNTKQLLASIGFLAYKLDSIPQANTALKNYGPESFHGDRITVKRSLINSPPFQSRMSMSAEHQVNLFLKLLYIFSLELYLT